MSVNQIVIIGNLGHDAQEKVETLASGNIVTELNLAVHRPKDKGGQEITDWIKCKFWNKKAEVLSKYAKKGDLISVSGSLRIDQWEYEGKKYYKTYIFGKDFQMLGGRKEEKTEMKAA